MTVLENLQWQLTDAAASRRTAARRAPVEMLQNAPDQGADDTGAR
jgi:hypothetical protein